MDAHRQAQVVLIIDDHPGNLGVAVGHLEGHAYEVITARDGASGSRRAREIRPSLILLDIELPGIDGYETCRRLKASPETCDIPVIFMTVRDASDEKVRGFELGAVDYVTKPFDASELVARVRTHLELSALRHELEAQVARRTAELERELELRSRLLQEHTALLAMLRRQGDQLRELSLGGSRPALDEPSSPSEPSREASAAFQPAALLGLSARESEVLHLSVKGRSNKEIAGILDLARTTVSTYRMRLMTKLEVEDAAALVRRAIELGFDGAG